MMGKPTSNPHGHRMVNGLPITPKIAAAFGSFHPPGEMPGRFRSLALTPPGLRMELLSLFSRTLSPLYRRSRLHHNRRQPSGPFRPAVTRNLHKLRSWAIPPVATEPQHGRLIDSISPFAFQILVRLQSGWFHVMEGSLPKL